MKKDVLCFLLFLCLPFMATGQDVHDFRFKKNDNGITITDYTGNAAEIVFPDKIDGVLVTEFGYDFSFTKKTSVTKITIPAGITWGKGLIPSYGVFHQYPNLAEIIVSGENENFSSMDGVLFDKDKTTLIKYPPAKTGSEYTIPLTVESIDRSAFIRCNNLEKIIIQRTVGVGRGVFGYCENLKEVSLLSQGVSFGPLAFYRCIRLESITLDAIESVTYGTFAETNFDEQTKAEILKRFGEDAFDNYGEGP